MLNAQLRISLALLAVWLILPGSSSPALGSTPVTAGYRDFSFGNTCNSTPTGEKPESKLWFNDGFWWASLCNPATNNTYHIYRLDLSSQNWIDTGTLLDDRPGTKADALWDDVSQKLYVVSHVWTNTGTPTSSSSQWGRLYRYTYSTATKQYTLDQGFPVNVTRGKSETLVIAKDSTATLWVTYVENNKVMVNHSAGSDSVWGTPYVLPVDSTFISVNSDDISSAIAFQGNKVGIMWSNQLRKKFYFAVHLDGDPDTAWQTDPGGIPGPPCSGDCGDDHINLKSIQVDSTGRVFAAIKTSLTASDAPLIMLTVRDKNGNWSSYVFGRKRDGHTRPVVLLDEENGRIYMFATSPEAAGSIYYKTTDINNISFVQGKGTVFIESSTDTKINNASSTKQNVNSTTGLLVIASDGYSHYYFHNKINLPSATKPTADFSASPVSGQSPLAVSFTDLSTGSPTSWAWDFGDGGTSTLQNPTHTYTAAAQYTVKLTSTNGAGSDTAIKTNYITVAASNTPVADFSGTPTSGQAPLQVTFTDLSTNSPTSWSWDFGDGSTSTLQNPTHTYTAASQYTVKLTATNGGGSDTATKTSYITVSTVLVADFSGTPTSGVVPLTVNFTDLSTGSPTDWSWDFGDGGTSTSQNPQHVYSAPGPYTVTLTVSRGTDSNTASKSNYIAVSGTVSPPVADFSGTPTSGQAPLIVNFTDLSTGSPTNWSWDFGDGSPPSTAQNPQHTYSTAQQYTVTLTVSNGAGSNTISKVNYITVTNNVGTVVYQETQTGGSTGVTSVSTLTSVTAASGDLYLAAVSTKGKVAVNAVSGLGLSWVRVGAQCGARNTTGIEVWMAQGTPTGNSIVTATLAKAPLNAVIAVSRYSGASLVSPIGNVLAGNVLGINGACTATAGSGTTSYSFTLSTPSTGAVAYGSVAIRNQTHTPGAGYTERAEVAQGSTSTDIAGAAIEDRTADPSSTIVNGALSSATDWAVIAIEIRP